MKEIAYTKHAEEKLVERDISKDIVELTLRMPKEIVLSRNGAKIAHGIVENRLLRVVFRNEVTYYKVITAYYTEKERYEVNK
jgi:hypothetical protein